jgi:predicted small integral membrane protein
LLDPIGHEYQVTWNERRPDLTFREIIVTIFTFIGIAVLFTVVAGVSFGGFRIFIKSRYPGRVFDRAQDMEIIQLKLDEGLRRKELGS